MRRTPLASLASILILTFLPAAVRAEEVALTPSKSVNLMLARVAGLVDRAPAAPRHASSI